MPALEFGSDALVLVSGANDFIAIHVIRSLLENGYRVRGTVRSTAKIPHLKTTFASYGDRLELIVVPDITVDGAFDEAIKGVDAVEHTASPVEPNFDDPQEAIRPAVNGTTSILNSVIKHGVSVKRVVVTSSCGAIYDISDQPRVFTEADWNQQACKEVEERGRDAGVMHKYRASKTLAEQAAWKLWVDNKARVNWDLTTINPPYVYGPIIHDVDGPDSLNASMRLWWMTVIQGNNDMAAAAAGSSAWVDVRDLALAHILALQKEDAGGKRLLVCAGPYILQDFIDAVHSIDPPPYPNLPVGDTGAGQRVTHMITYDNRKTTEIIGLGSNEQPYITKEQCARDIIDGFVKRGWKP